MASVMAAYRRWKPLRLVVLVRRSARLRSKALLSTLLLAWLLKKRRGLLQQQKARLLLLMLLVRWQSLMLQRRSEQQSALAHKRMAWREARLAAGWQRNQLSAAQR